jgi:hypothetical protein
LRRKYDAKIDDAASRSGAGNMVSTVQRNMVVSAVFGVAVIVQRTWKWTGIRCMIKARVRFDSISTRVACAMTSW